MFQVAVAQQYATSSPPPESMSSPGQSQPLTSSIPSTTAGTSAGTGSVSNPASRIVGGVVGGILGLVVLLALLGWLFVKVIQAFGGAM
ncbi:hypothetical protein FRC06_011152 [Ceratobasidium sp. 370]|nr:hypothetical protein FRC06_011152 [Ceratobasidium sp. 370]